MVGIFLPQILGTGREPMISVLGTADVQYTIGLLLILGLVKVLMTSLSLAGGFVGGIFAPSLFVGTMLGGAFGRVINSIFQSGAISDPQAYAIAGMAAVMAGVVRAPITAIMLVFEVTNDYRLILPIMLASVTCVFLAEMFEPDGVYALGLRRKGVRLHQGRDIDVMQGLTVHDAMLTPAPTIHADASLLELRDALRKFHAHGISVVDDHNHLIGIVTLTDLQKAYEAGMVEGYVRDIMIKEVVTTEPDEPLWTAIRHMGQRDIGRLPVLDPVTHEPIGVLTRNSIMRAYNQAITAQDRAAAYRGSGAAAYLDGRARRRFFDPPRRADRRQEGQGSRVAPRMRGRGDPARRAVDRPARQYRHSPVGYADHRHRSARRG